MASNGSPSTPALTEGEQTILSMAKSFYLNDAYSDMKIICGDKIFPAHKMVLCYHSEYFRRACSGNFAEASGEIRLDGKVPILIETMLEFLYKGSYRIPDDPRLLKPRANSTQQPPPKRLRTSDEIGGNSCAPRLISYRPAYFRLRMYGLADYFMIDSLKEMAKRQFPETLNQWHTYCPSSGIRLIIEEVYSTRGNYGELKTPLAKKIAQKCAAKNSWFGRSNLRSDIVTLKSIPGSAGDLLEELMAEIIRGEGQT